MAWHTTLQTLDDDSVLTKNLQDIVFREIQASKCTKVLGKGADGRVQRVCYNECSRCEVLKVALNSDGVTLAEAMVLKQITQNVPNSDPQSRHILRYIRSFRLRDSVGLAQPVWLFTNFVKPAKQKTLKTFASKASLRELQWMLLQIFGTLAHIAEKVPGFLHMDLKGENIALMEWPSDIQQETIEGITIPRQKLWPVLIDFGYSKTDDVPFDFFNEDSEWQGQCYFQGFDVFRLLMHIGGSAANADYCKNLFFRLYSGPLSERPLLQNTAHMNVDYGMWNAQGCRRAQTKSPTQKDVALAIADDLKKGRF